jgi:hypothetical protein
MQHTARIGTLLDGSDRVTLVPVRSASIVHSKELPFACMALPVRVCAYSHHTSRCRARPLTRGATRHIGLFHGGSRDTASSHATTERQRVLARTISDGHGQRGRGGTAFCASRARFGSSRHSEPGYPKWTPGGLRVSAIRANS